MEKYIVTTRFNNQTWNENQEYLKKLNDKRATAFSPSPIKCIYPVSHILQQYATQTVFFILEMNNETNQIMGIGLVKNSPIYNKYKIYKTTAYNEFSFIGYFRIDRRNMDMREETIMKVLDYYCFTGKTHLKRLKGIKKFPQKILDKCNPTICILDFITEMFRKRAANETVCASNIVSHKSQINKCKITNK
jgi:hypothetical protein